jgi:hypothetical protein
MNHQQQIDHFLLTAHRLALSRVRAQPEQLEPVRSQLSRWRSQAGATRSDVYWDEWQALLNGDVEQLERVVCAENEHAAVLRSVSPMSTLITQSERAQLLREARKTL